MGIDIRDLFLTFKGVRLAQSVLNKTQFMSSAEIAEFQLSALKRTLIQAYCQIPYYQKLFWEHDFDPYSLKSLDALSRLPVLSKKDVISAPSDFCSFLTGERTVELHTSGTTGNPMATFTSERQWVVEQAAIWRQWKWAGYRFRDKMAIIRSYAPKAGEPLTKFDRLKNWLYISPYNLDEKNVLDHLRVLKKWQPKFLRGYPSSLYLFARVARTHKKTLPSLKAALTASEVLSEEYRWEIEEAFGIPVFDHYGQAEISAMLHECEYHTGLHILDDYAYTELLDSDTPGQKRLIATNLFNDVMPLIRYNTGDLVIPKKGECPCGRSFRLVYRIIGRADQMLVHREGYFLPPVNFYTYFSKFKDILRYQIVQESETKVKVLVQSSRGEDISRTRKIIQKEMALRFGGPVEVIETEAFVLSGEGKCNIIVQQIRW